VGSLLARTDAASNGPGAKCCLTLRSTRRCAASRAARVSSTLANKDIILITAFELAGFFAAHAIWCVSDGSVLIPMYAYTKEDGGREMERLAMDNLESAVTLGKEKLVSNEYDANEAVFLYDGRIPIKEEKLDAIIIEIRAFFSPQSEAIMAVPYRPKAFLRPFRVHKPKILLWKDCEDFNINAAVDSFFKGVDAHEKGSAMWNKALDQSI
jgi:hypothetical protein